MDRLQLYDLCEYTMSLGRISLFFLFIFIFIVLMEFFNFRTNAIEEASPVKLTQRISSAFFPRFRYVCLC